MYYVNELYHHGVKGQKWGVRRYQNTDGTRTELGARREQRMRKYVDSEGKKTELGEKREKQFKPGKNGKASAAEKMAKGTVDVNSAVKSAVKHIPEKQPEKKDYSMLTDDEIRQRINRIELERRYSSLTNPTVRTGKDKALEVLDMAGDVLSIAAAGAAIGTSLYSMGFFG